MKLKFLNISKIIFTALIVIIAVTSCSSDDSNPEDNNVIDVEFTALVDGVQFIANEVSGLGLETSEGNILTINANKESGEFINITLPSTDAGTYGDSTTDPDFQIITLYSPDGQTTFTGTSGTITIIESSQINTNTIRVKATFSFTYSDISNTTVYQVTEGSFNTDFIVF